MMKNTSFSFVYSFALDNTFFPLPHIAISIFGWPHANSMPLPCLPLSRIKLTVWPSKLTFPIFFALSKVSIISAMLSDLNTSLLRAILPFAFKEISLSYLDSNSIFFSINNLTKIKISVFQINKKVWIFYKFNHSDIFIFGTVVFNKLQQISLMRNENIDICFKDRLIFTKALVTFLCFLLNQYKIGQMLKWSEFFPFSFLFFYLFFHIMFHWLFSQRIFFACSLVNFFRSWGVDIIDGIKSWFLHSVLFIFELHFLFAVTIQFYFTFMYLPFEFFGLCGDLMFNIVTKMSIEVIIYYMLLELFELIKFVLTIPERNGG